MQYWVVSLARPSAPQLLMHIELWNSPSVEQLPIIGRQLTDNHAGSNYTHATIITTTITAYLHCTHLCDAMLCRLYSYYVPWSAVV